MHAALELTPTELAEVRAILRKHLSPDVAILAFGSRTKGPTKRFSDLDLCLRGPGLLPPETLGALHDAFELSNLPWKVDLVDWHSTDETFRRLIERQHTVLQL